MDVWDLKAGARVKGLLADQEVEIVAIKDHGRSIRTATYKTDAGALGEIMLMAEDYAKLELVNTLKWTFKANGERFKLASEAYRISLAHLFDPYLAMRTSQIQALPHQISAVYKDMLPKMPLRFVLADDPGAGKTIMTGLLIKEMILRGDLKRCLIVSPGNLVEQWQDELYRKFGLHFKLLTNDMLDAAVTRNAFKENDFLIARLDKLSRNEEVQEKLKASEWDLIVCDEAHKMAATVFGNEVKYTKRYHLGELLGEITENLLLLTATPHNGKPEDFQLFMALVDKDRFEGAAHSNKKTTSAFIEPDQLTMAAEYGISPIPQGEDLSDVMRRLVKEELLKFDGKPLFPERRASTVNYTLSSAEADLYQAVTDYVSEEFNRADRLDGKHKNSVGFALTILQRRLASSPEAIFQSLKRRRERLEARLQDAKAVANGTAPYSQAFYTSEDFDEDDYSSEEWEELEEEFIDTASAAATAAELEAEITTLKALENKANEVRMSGEDRKWDELSRLLQDNKGMFSDDGRREKLIIFTEHKDTLDYLATKIRSLLGSPESVITIKGGMSRDDRHKAEELFKQDKNVRILVATDAAGEGINLQRAHLMVNYDLPWNPNRIEQRFGRVHRIGQTEVCHLWNLVAKETREGQVFERLFNKLNEERSALGGRVFDILGRVTFEDKPLRELLIEAIRYGDQPEVRERLNKVVDSSLDTDGLKKLLEQYALTADIMDATSVMKIREDMERMEAHKLEPHFIEAFFLDAFIELGGKVAKREDGRYEVMHVPLAMQGWTGDGDIADPILPSYERIAFDKEHAELINGIPADLICPGHPLLDATIALTLKRDDAALKQGTVLIDSENENGDIRMLLYLESAITDGTIAKDGTKKVVSKAVHFVEIDIDGNARRAGYAPYLDYAQASESQMDEVLELIEAEGWSYSDPSDVAINYAIANILPEHIESVRERTLASVEKIEKAVDRRLTAEIQYWDSKAWELKNKEDAGSKSKKQTSAYAEKRAEELAQRRQSRLEELALAKQLAPLPPKLVGAAMVVPICKLSSNATSEMNACDSLARQEIEQAGMSAVFAIEEELGFIPRDVSMEKCGYDIESTVPAALFDEEEKCLRLIEVKGRAAGADTVTVSKNEILCALNSPENFYLAVVEVDGNTTRTTYLKRPFSSPPDWAVTNVTYNLKHLFENAEVVFKKEQIWQ